MFDFLKWRAWLEGEAERLRGEGVAAEFRSRDVHLKFSGLSVVDQNRIGDFRSWENGLVDYEVMDSASHNFLANEAMIAVDDKNFAQVFESFLKIVRD